MHSHSSLHVISSCLERNCVDNVIVYIQNFMLGFRVISFCFVVAKSFSRWDDQCYFQGWKLAS